MFRRVGVCRELNCPLCAVQRERWRQRDEQRGKLLALLSARARVNVSDVEVIRHAEVLRAELVKAWQRTVAGWSLPMSERN